MTLSDSEKDRVVELARQVVSLLNDSAWCLQPFDVWTNAVNALRAALDPPKPPDPLPCPFCGKQPIVESYCVKCTMGHNVFCYGETEAEAIANWNRRVT